MRDDCRMDDYSKYIYYGMLLDCFLLGYLFLMRVVTELWCYSLP
jgi:hypothetical protein